MSLAGWEDDFSAASRKTTLTFVPSGGSAPTRRYALRDGSGYATGARLGRMRPRPRA